MKEHFEVAEDTIGFFRLPFPFLFSFVKNYRPKLFSSGCESAISVPSAKQLPLRNWTQNVHSGILKAFALHSAFWWAACKQEMLCTKRTISLVGKFFLFVNFPLSKFSFVLVSTSGMNKGSYMVFKHQGVPEICFILHVSELVTNTMVPLHVCIVNPI